MSDSLFRTHEVIQRTPSKGEIAELQRVQEKAIKKEEAARQRAKDKGVEYNPHGKQNPHKKWESQTTIEARELDRRLREYMTSED